MDKRELVCPLIGQVEYRLDLEIDTGRQSACVGEKPGLDVNPDKLRTLW